MRQEHLPFCPCGMENPYEICCGPFLSGDTFAQTPEQLMRSRYTAYTQGNVDYIKRTMSAQALKGFDAVKAARWANAVTWRGLRVLKASSIEQDNHRGTVEFIAYYEEQGQLQQLHEISVFRKKGNQWYYVDALPNEFNPRLSRAEPIQKAGRNDPCPCGSGKKYKKCCLAK